MNRYVNLTLAPTYRDFKTMRKIRSYYSIVWRRAGIRFPPEKFKIAALKTLNKAPFLERTEKHQNFRGGGGAIYQSIRYRTSLGRETKLGHKEHFSFIQ